MRKAVRCNVIFRPFEGDDVSEGGIIVPDSVKQVSDKGVIVSVGGGTSGKPMYLKEGQVAYRVKGYGQEVEIDGKKHFIMNQDAIIALDD